MKTVITLFISLVISLGNAHGQTLKPYWGGLMTETNFTEAQSIVREGLEAQGLEILGEYQPAKDANRWVLVYTSTELKSAVKSAGPERAYALAQRMAIYKSAEGLHLSATNPSYWCAAYFQEDFNSLQPKVKSTEGKLKGVFSSANISTPTAYGSQKGLDLKDLFEYQYMFGMPEFDDHVKLKGFNSFEEANAALKKGLAQNSTKARLVYSISLLGEKAALYGIGLFGADGEQKFLPIIDIDNPKHSCFLPYEILVLDNEVFMLHGRYRIALSFPDLTMRTFSKIMSTPGDIENAMKSLLD
ncbi:MAG: hypothetical protein RL754_381 [Bacteroidota bacterium]|jgi:hypothetical protein